MMKRIWFLPALLAAALPLVSAFRQQPAAPPPNIVLVFMDDLGYGDLSCYGATGYTTPNLDRMAREGMRFTNFLTAQAVCSASRAALLTGCYPNRIGFSGALWPNARMGIAEEETTLAEMLKPLGYATAAFGKWHLGSETRFLPLQHGFDEYTGLPFSNDMWPVWYDGTPAGNRSPKSHFPPLPLLSGNDTSTYVHTLEQQGTLTGLYTEKAVDFIRRNKRNPFFLYLPHSMPHVPIAVSPPYAGKSGKGLWADLMLEIDDSIGRILESLRQEGLDDNTLVIFTSDNGPWLNFGNHAGSAGGFREGKGTSFEGGHRVPAIFRWPGTIPAGTVRNQLWTTIDILPTLAELSGAALPTLPIDGISFADALTDAKSTAARPFFAYFYRRNSLEAVRKDHWKLVFPHPGRTYEGFLPGNDGFPGPTTEEHITHQALYDLRRDPAERYDVQLLYPDVVRELETYAESVRNDLGDDLQKREGSGRRPIGRIP
ncbi:MAG: hypothetical protein RLY31_195 [Bacteroidota bacterium]|jgi:arylsulfatase